MDISAIAEYRDDRYGTVRIRVSQSCNLCVDEAGGPLCVRYCAPGALTLDSDCRQTEADD